MERARTLVVVVGPTGIGKTAMAIALARHFKTAVLSADSRQFYKELSIGTAVPSREELDAVPHYFIQHKHIHDPYSVGDFEREALSVLTDLFKEHGVVIMAGGSGLYIDAVTMGFDSFPEIDPSVRELLNTELQTQGLPSLQQALKKADPTYAQKVDLQNPQRVIRALEVFRGTGKPYSSFLKKKKTKRPFTTVFLGLDAPRDVLYERINLRVDRMMEAGLLEEVNAVKEYAHLNALQTVGYKELFKYLAQECSLEDAIAEIKKNTRRYAKRQGTWFRKKTGILWVPYDLPAAQVIEKLTPYISKTS